MIISGIVVFLVIDKTMRAVMGGAPGHSHAHAHASKPAAKAPAGKRGSRSRSPSPSQAKELTPAAASETVAKSLAPNDFRNPAVCLHRPLRPDCGLHRAAFLNLVADATHNFTDGLAIGVAFGRHEHEVATTLAVLLHELPHEVGDVAILIAAGYRPSQAVKMQFCTALGAMCGTIVGLLSGTYFSALSEVRQPARLHPLSALSAK